MRYTTWEDVVARYPRAATIGTANPGEAAAERAYILPAEATVDASLALRYTTPVANTPTLAPDSVRDVATDLAYWKMAWMTLDERIEKILRESINDRLSALATGSLSLVGSGGLVTVPTAPSAVWGTHQDYSNIGGVDSVEDWGVSSLELSAQEDVRGD